MFLFSDLLIVAKPQNKAKLRSNLRLKERIALVDIWLSENVKECSSMDVSGDTSFVIGWPTVNYIVSFRLVTLLLQAFFLRYVYGSIDFM